MTGSSILTSTGNYPPTASIEACHSKGEPDATTEWVEILTSVKLEGNQHHLYSIQNEGLWTHLRLNIFPDGGIARLRVYGEFHLDWEALGEQGRSIWQRWHMARGWSIGATSITDHPPTYFTLVLAPIWARAGRHEGDVSRATSGLFSG
jgi:allantoicase